MKNLIKIDDRFFTVSLENDKPVVKESKPEEIIEHEFENIVILEEDAVDTSMFQKIIDDTRRNMEHEMTQNLKQLVLSCLGFSQSSGGYQIHGMSEKNSVVANAIADKVKERIMNIDLAKDLDLTPLEKKKLRAEMKHTYKESFCSSVRNLVYKEAQREALDAVDNMKRELLGDKMKIVAKTMVEEAIRKSKSRY